MVVASVTKGPLLYADDATLKSGMDHRDNPSPVQSGAVDPLRALDDERQSKIAKLKQAVADGTYHVSAEELADKLIQHMLEPKG
jgi:flagellar biosynthesis anti-sigma factor FlgM